MNYLTFIAAAVFTGTLLEGAYVLLVNPKARENRLYFCMALCLCVWLFGAGMAYTAHDKSAVVLLFRISSFGFLFLHAFTLHFSIAIATRPRRRPFRWSPLLIYLPSIYFVYRSLTSLIVYRDFIRVDRLWIALPAFGSPDLALLVVHYVSYYAVSAALIARWWRRSSGRRERRQAGLILVSTVSTIFLFNLEPFILPLFTGGASIAISPIFGVIWVGGIGYAIWKYRFLRWTPEPVAGDILGNIDEAIAVLDAARRTVYLNASARRLLGPRADERADSSADGALESLLGENPAVAADLSRLLSGELRDFSCRLPVPSGGREFIDLKCSRIVDGYGDIAGAAIIGRPVRDEIRFKARFPLTDKEMEALRLVVGGKKTEEMAEALGVAQRTVKYYLSSIYAKLGVKNKIELYNKLREYNLFSEQASEQSAFPLLLKKRD